MKIWMITSGGDWADASAVLVACDSDVDLESEKAKYNDWYRDEYLPELRRRQSQVVYPLPKGPKYFTFAEWLVDRLVVRYPRPDEAEEFSE